MGRVAKDMPITTASARSRLPPGEYARRLDAEGFVRYRKGKRGGVWFARWRNWGPGSNYRQTEIGPANDVNDKPTEGLLTFLQAEKEAREIVAKARQEMRVAVEGPMLTVRLVVETYISERDARDSRRKGRTVRSDAGQRLRRYILGQGKRGKQEAIPAAALADLALHAVKEADLRAWRNKLPATLKTTAKQRTINDVKAALNGAYEAHRERLGPTLPAVIKHGLRALTVDEDVAVSGARGNQILTDAQVGALLKAAREVDDEGAWEGDLFRLVVVLAATGGRFSQVTRIKVDDFQRAQSRLLVPVSRKGRGAKSGSTPVPVGADVLDALLPVTTGRPSDTPLLERWRYRQVAGTIRWERAGRGPWHSASELQRPWHDIRERAKIPDVIPYALRHSSIVRGIRVLPIRLVAALHDTSVPMIERHYGKWIVDGLEELAARAVIPLVPVRESNVVRLGVGS
jgi:integrase